MNKYSLTTKTKKYIKYIFINLEYKLIRTLLCKIYRNVAKTNCRKQFRKQEEQNVTFSLVSVMNHNKLDQLETLIKYEKVFISSRKVSVNDFAIYKLVFEKVRYHKSSYVVVKINNRLFETNIIALKLKIAFK